MQFLANPIVKWTLSTVAGILVASSQVPTLAPFSVVLAPIGTGILGWLHAPRPGDVKAAQ